MSICAGTCANDANDVSYAMRIHKVCVICVFTQVENIQLERKLCKYHGALQSVVWGGPAGVRDRARRELGAKLELLEE